MDSEDGLVLLSLGEQKPLDAINVTNPLNGQHLALAAKRPVVFLLGGASPSILSVFARRYRPDRGGINDVAFDSFPRARDGSRSRRGPLLNDDERKASFPSVAASYSGVVRSAPVTSRHVTECFDIFCPLLGDNDVIKPADRLSSNETKIAPRSVRIIIGA
jgi:hypothetical protein